MSGKETERAVHDYLDGRMSDEERRAFEARLGREPELARTVETYREPGRLLRDETIELPPGFHARARARFESRRSPRLDWRRFVSWEATGVLAAAVLLTALIFPEVWERYRRRPEAPSAGPTVESPAADPEPKAPATEEEREAELFAGRDHRLEERRDEPTEDVREKPAISAEAEARAEEKTGTAPADEVVATAPSEPNEKRQAAELSKDRAVRRDRAAEEGLASQEMQVAPRQDAETDTFGDRSGEKHEFAPAPAAAPSSAKKGPAAPRIATIPAGVVGEDELTVISDAAAWESILRRPSADALEVLRPDFSSERVALLGPIPGREGCDALRVIQSFDRIVIAWPTTSQRRGGVDVGCAVVIPANGLPVELGPDY